MKTAVVFRHVPFEDLATLADVLHAQGYQWRYIDTPVSSLTQLDPLAADLLVVLGGQSAHTKSISIRFLSRSCDIFANGWSRGNRCWASV